MTEPTVQELYDRRRNPLLLSAAVIAIVSVAVARLPESLVNLIERNRFLDGPSSGWAYRLLALFAAAQALYGGFFVLRVDRVKKSRVDDPKVAAMSRARVVTSLARNAGGMTLLTLIYGVAAFGVTGQRGGFWLFPLLCLLQGAWYFRELGAVARWLAFQPDVAVERIPDAVWRREPPDYTPPIARALKPVIAGTANSDVAEPSTS